MPLLLPLEINTQENRNFLKLSGTDINNFFSAVIYVFKRNKRLLTPTYLGTFIKVKGNAIFLAKSLVYMFKEDRQLLSQYREYLIKAGPYALELAKVLAYISKKDPGFLHTENIIRITNLAKHLNGFLLGIKFLDRHNLINFFHLNLLIAAKGNSVRLALALDGLYQLSFDLASARNYDLLIKSGANALAMQQGLVRLFKADPKFLMKDNEHYLMASGKEAWYVAGGIIVFAKNNIVLDEYCVNYLINSKKHAEYFAVGFCLLKKSAEEVITDEVCEYLVKSQQYALKFAQGVLALYRENKNLVNEKSFISLIKAKDHAEEVAKGLSILSRNSFPKQCQKNSYTERNIRAVIEAGENAVSVASALWYFSLTKVDYNKENIFFIKQAGAKAETLAFSFNDLQKIKPALLTYKNRYDLLKAQENSDHEILDKLLKSKH